MASATTRDTSLTRLGIAALQNQPTVGLHPRAGVDRPAPPLLGATAHTRGRAARGACLGEQFSITLCLCPWCVRVVSHRHDDETPAQGWFPPRAREHLRPFHPFLAHSVPAAPRAGPRSRPGSPARRRVARHLRQSTMRQATWARQHALRVGQQHDQSHVIRRVQDRDLHQQQPQEGSRPDRGARADISTPTFARSPTPAAS